MLTEVGQREKIGRGFWGGGWDREARSGGLRPGFGLLLGDRGGGLGFVVSVRKGRGKHKPRTVR